MISGIHEGSNYSYLFLLLLLILRAHDTTLWCLNNNQTANMFALFLRGKFKKARGTATYEAGKTDQKRRVTATRLGRQINKNV